MSKQKVSVFWFRRDLRLDDNRGLHNALQSDFPVIPVFTFDKHILNDLLDKKRRQSLFYSSRIK